KGLTYLLLPENLIQKEREKQELPQVSEQHFVLTVSHEYGSGGRTIARRIAHELGLPYYDTEIIKMAAERSDFAEEYLKEHEEKITSTALYRLFDWYTGALPGNQRPVQEQIFQLEAKVIQEIAAKDSCVIVGRLANYILQKHRNSLHIFITADEKERVQRVMRKENISAEEALDRIQDFASDRKNHCQEFSDMEWGNGMNYDITIKSNRYGVDRTAAILIQLIKEFRMMQF
ncbi:MAG: cytidylate kinase-like family protein, partial [Veillonellaceae bacterium]|nr:cytidylate kinase-like family protein [Veillonellaceae bacterium]